MKIILGSGSDNRREAMSIVELDYEIMIPDVDEKQVDQQSFDRLEDRALAIASLKADAIAEKVGRDSIIITADGFNECDGRVLEKPQDIEEARDMLQLLSNNKTVFFSALVMLNVNTEERFTEVVSTACWFRTLSELEIDDYLDSTDVLKYAAAYSPFNTKAISFIKKIEGSASGFSHSLPLDVVIPKLRQWGAIS